MSTSPTLTWEQYQQLPPEQRRRPLTAAEYAALTRSQRTQAGLEDEERGAPADFAGPVFPNPDHITPQLDTDSVVPETRLPHGVSFNHENYSGGAEARTVGTEMNAPKLPPGAELESGSGDSTIKLPAGAKLESAPQQSSSEEQPSALSRFGHNFLSGLGVASNEDAKNFFEHPIHTAMNALNAQGELAMKARDAYNRGDYKSAVIHGLNYLVPFIGQQTDKAGEQLSQGDIAGGVGRTLGVAAPIVAGSPQVRAGVSNAARAATAPIKPALSRAGAAATAVGESLDPDIVGLVSPRAAHALRLASKAGRVATKLGEQAAPEEAAIPAEVAPTDPPTEMPSWHDFMKDNMKKFGGDHAKIGAAYRELKAQYSTLEQSRGLATGAQAPIDPAAGLAQPVRQSSVAATPETTAAESSPQASSDAAPRPNTSPKAIQQQIEDSLGGKKLVPGVSLKNQPAAMGAKLPEGFTPVESSLVRGYKYDPATERFDTILNSGQHYAHSGVTPEQAAKFEAAESQGSAWNTLRKEPGVVQVEKNFSPTKPATMRSPESGEIIPKSKAGMQREVIVDPQTGKPEFSDVVARSARDPKATPAAPDVPANADLSSVLQQSLDQVRAAKKAPQSVGAVLSELKDTAAFRQALQELGPNAPLGKVAERAQQITQAKGAASR